MERPQLPFDGETALWVPVDEDAVLIAGASDPLPTTITALLNGDPSASAEVQVISWQRAMGTTEASSGFLMLVSLKTLRSGRLASILFRPPGRTTRFALGRKPASIQALLNILMNDSGAAFPTIIDGLIEILLTSDRSPKSVEAARHVLNAVARPSGIIEITGAVEPRGIFLQGWASDLHGGQTRVLVASGGLSFGRVDVAIFSREDLGERAKGFIALLEMQEAVTPERIAWVFFRARDGWRKLDIYDQRLIIETIVVPAHVRDRLVGASAPAETLARLRTYAQRFDGRDTVSTLDCPVRLGLDLATIIDRTGFLLAGWLFDPERLVQAVTLRTNGNAFRLDDGWTRLVRPDVTSLFASDSRFAHLNGEANHGFVAFAPRALPGNGQPNYLELEFAGEPSAYFPLAPGRSPLRQALQRLLRTVDPRSASAIAVAERQVAAALYAAEPPAPRIVEVLESDWDIAVASLTLVIGLDGRESDVRALLTQLALDADARITPIVVALPVQLYDSLGAEIQRLSRFLKLPVRLVLAEGVEDVCDALEAGAGAAETETLAFLSGAAHLRTPGWLGRLERAYRARGSHCVVSPTLVFEDDSIRWAGTWLEGERSARRISNRLVGYPRDAIGNFGLTEIAAGSTECCVLAQSAFQQVGGFTRGYLQPAEKSLDLCLKLRMAGYPSLWLPEVELYLADNFGEGDSPPHLHLAQLADCTSFDRRWSLAIANMKA